MSEMLPPTRIPISKRASMSLSSSSPPKSTDLAKSTTGSTPQTKIPMTRRYSQQIARQNDSERHPGDRAELQEAYSRSMDLYSSELPSPHLNSPLHPLTPSTPFDDELPDDMVPDGDGQDRAASIDDPVSRIPHSSSSFNLRSHAITPGKDVNLGLSRIPQSKVRHAVALQSMTSESSPQKQTRSVSSPNPKGDALRSPLLGPPSPGRLSPSPYRGMGSAASTRVIDGLQTDLAHMRMQVEKVRQDFKSSQRIVESLTRQNEDLKETRERLRTETGQLNGVIARKERFLQETAERRRNAEAEAAELRSTRQALEKSTRKSLQQMTAEVSEAHLAQQRAESECSSLRDSVRSLREVWAREVKATRLDWKRDIESERIAREEMKAEHARLLELLGAQTDARKEIQMLAASALEASANSTEAYEKQLAGMREQVEAHGAETKEAQETAQHLAHELMHLRRLMRRDDP